ncbi:carbonyl reductase [Saccharata proteae CBS 121410]|uniref:Carbonyl reductase n=1 Tax=Saccharata proteae CBS 121410 TaxID=1314787 RepID=A0A9P4LZ29_9PEZI|nr:carbonyl reductase [Saccharata proteae CBS 121410]
MPVYSRIAAVTGANKGIGLGIIRNLALTYPTSPLASSTTVSTSSTATTDTGTSPATLLIYLTARSATRGLQALQSIEEDEDIQQAGVLVKDGGSVEVKFRELDIGSKRSVEGFAEWLGREHGGATSGGTASGEGVLDVLVNNAGIALDGFDSDIVNKTLDVNYHGTLNATTLLLPLLKPTGRIVNVASMAGHLKKYSPELRDRFLAAKTPDAVTALMSEFAEAVKAGNHAEKGWPSSAYAVSKAGVIGMTRAVARQEKGRGGGRLINSCCPGYVNTDMTKGNGVKTVDEGARTPVMLAFEDVGGRTGEFWQSEKVIEW